MDRQKKLAMKIMEFACEITGLPFQVDCEKDFYVVSCELFVRENVEFLIYFTVGKKDAQLSVYSSGYKCDEDWLIKQFEEQFQNIYLSCEVKGTNIYITNLMPLEVMEDEMDIIVGERMFDIAGMMIDIIKHNKGIK